MTALTGGDAAWLPTPAVVGVLGLDSTVLTGFLVALAVVVFLWGFERYRNTFSKREFLVATVLSLGVLTVGVFPGVVGAIADVFAVERRSLVVSLFANTALILLVLYLFARTRANQVSINELTRSLAVEQAADATGAAEGGGTERTIHVVIPAYNEGESVASVVEALPATLRGRAVRPVVVSDGSTDDTAARVAGADGLVVEHPINQGQGSALKTGFDIARDAGAEVVVTMDADGQHPAEQLDALIGPIVEGTADYVAGSRYAGVDDSGNSAARRTGIHAFTAAINLLTKARITDCTNGFRAIRGTELDGLTLTEDRFSAPELIIEARKKGLRIEEIPVTISEREAGESKKPSLGYAVGLGRTILTTWIR